MKEAEIKKKVAELKKAHKVNEIIVLQSEDGKTAFLKNPSRDQMKYAMQASQGNPIEMSEHILESGWLEGDEDLKNDDKYFYDISRQIDSVVETKNVEIKKY